MAHLNDMGLKEKVRGGVIGHAIGDALGVPVEFTNREQLALFPLTDMVGFGTHHVPAGTWSDDTSMEIALMQSLIDCQAFDYENIMGNFYKWWKDDEFTATGNTFDIGSTCYSAINNYLRGTPAKECGETGERSNGNGSLMRILPVAYVCYTHDLPDQARYQLVRDVSSLTHAHEISVLGCYIYVNYVIHLLGGDTPAEAYQKMQAHDYSMFSEATRDIYRRVLVDDIAKLDESDISARGYVVSSLEASLWSLLTTGSYQEAVLKAVNLGDDTDTVGAITGSMAGIVYGFDSLPADWTQKLQRYDYLLDLCDKFAETDITL